jgi:2-keto-4-pentenoate hydratase
MYFELMDATAERLAKSRRHETCCELPLDKITSDQQAMEIQVAALDALGFERKGYAIAGSSEASRRMLGLSKPIFSEVPASAYYPSRAEIRLPPGVIGAQCEVAFTMLRSYPDLGEPLNRKTATEAILAYQPAIGILGYRTQQRYPGDSAAIADFGLHVATVRGDHAMIDAPEALSEVKVNAFLFKRTIVSGSLDSIFGHPLDAVVWLASQLSARGHQLQPNDIVTTGSCTTILQVIPGQHMAAEFGPLGQVECLFT